MIPDIANTNSVHRIHDDIENPTIPSLEETRYYAVADHHRALRQSLIEGPPIPVHYVATKTPKDTLKTIYKVGQYKAALPLNLLCVQSFMAGFFIAMAGHLFLAVGGGILGEALFPVALIAVVLTSAELFTGDALVFIISVLGRQVPVSKLVRNWTVSWIWNFVGALTWAAVLAYASDALEAQRDLAILVATKKASQTWLQAFLKGIGANFMVCLGVWQATCAEDVAGKIVSIWFPVMAFVAMGFEHSIADQFFLPVGMMYGADISIATMFWNVLIPATVGNIVGGGFVMGAIYWYVFDSMTNPWNPFGRVQNGRKTSTRNSRWQSISRRQEKHPVQTDLESNNVERSASSDSIGNTTHSS
jgi:formate/nitrite transporter